MDVAGTLFRQATQTFDYQVFDATAILCRAKIDALFHAFLTLEWDSQGMVHSSDQFDLTGDWRRVYFSELAKALRQRNILSKEEWKFVTRIREDGNYSAHLGSLQREREVKLFQEMAQIQTEHKRQGISIEDTTMAFKGLVDKQVAMRKPRALQNLRDTALVYSRIVNSIRIPDARAVMTGAIGLEDPLT